MILVGLASFLLFLLFQTQGIYGGDTGDLVTAAYLGGVPHPPGYPFYTLLGWLVAKLPISTVAWRVTLLSSIPHAVTVAFVYSIVRRLTKHRVPALFAASVLAGNYLFFLYSVTPEVFALFDLFIVLLIWLLIRWQQTSNRTYVFWASFVFGLSLSHHHVVLFLVPAIVYWLMTYKKLVQKHWHIGLVGYGALGLLPYLYLPLAGAGSSIINWNRPDTLNNFIRLVTRADYGTFVSSGFYGTLLPQRLAQLKAYGQFMVLDLTVVGILLAILGFWRLWKQYRSVCWFMAIAILWLGPLFYFYASFPLVNRFTLGTYERFMLSSYVLFSIVIGMGVWHMLEKVDEFVRGSGFRIVLLGALTAVLFLYPMSIGSMSLWRFWGLATDRTAENLAVDILASVPTDGILFVARDTPLFTTQYMRYALGVRPDVMLIHSSRLATDDYAQVLRRAFPQLQLPEASGNSFQAALVNVNRDRFPILTNVPFAVDERLVWVPYGLLYRLVSEGDAPSPKELIAQNNALWKTYHNPTAGILSRYDHLMLSDVRDVYTGARLELGKTLLRAGETDEAKVQFEAATSYGGDTQTSDAYIFLGLSQLFSKNCQEALAAFARAREVSITPDPSLSLYEGVTYRDCVGDVGRATELLDTYESQQKQSETPLER